jgi:hypothetical protein
MAAFHDNQVIKLRAELHMDPTLLRNHPQEIIEEYVRNKLANDLVKQILDEDLIIVKHSIGTDPFEDEQFRAELTVIQE